MSSIIGDLIFKLKELNDTPHLYMRKRKDIKLEIDELKDQLHCLDIFELSTYIYSILINNHGLAEEFNIRVENGIFEFELDKHTIFFSSTFRGYEIESRDIKFAYTPINKLSSMAEKRMEILEDKMRSLYYNIIDDFIWIELFGEEVDYNRQEENQ